MPLLRVSALHKYYGDHHVLKGVDLTIEEGEVVAIIGRSGSGKSTLLRTLNGLESISDGVIEVDDEYLDASRADLRALRQKVGMVFQQFNLFPHLSVGENVMLAPQVVKKVDRAQARQLAEQMLARVGLGDKFDAYPERLSGGQQQRVAIAPGAGHVAKSVALRRNHLGARPGAGQRGARRGSPTGQGRHDADHGHPRNALCAGSGRQTGVHASRQGA